jgi:hypothetical protein
MPSDVHTNVIIGQWRTIPFFFRSNSNKQLNNTRHSISKP